MKANVSIPRLSMEGESKTFLEHFANEVLDILMGAKKKGTVRIKFTKTTLPRHVAGNQRETEVTVSWNLQEWDLLSTLAHELVHVEQVVSGKLGVWQRSTPEGTPYLSLPWEVEAFRLEGPLALAALENMITERPELAKGWTAHCGRFGTLAATTARQMRKERAA